MISFRCLFCDQKYNVRDEQAGDEIKCSSCGALIAVPEEIKYRTVDSSELNRRDASTPVGKENAPRPLPANQKRAFQAIGVVIFLLSLMIPFSKAFFRLMRGRQQRPAVNRPFNFQAERPLNLNWHEYTSEEGDFSIDVSGDMTAEETLPPFASRRFQWTFSMITGSVTVVDLTESIVNDLPRNLIFALFQNQILNDIKKQHQQAANWRLTQQSTPQFHEFESEGGFGHMRGRLVISGTRLYALTIVDLDPLFRTPAEIANRYFNSFQVKERVEAERREKPTNSYQERLRTFEKKLSRQMTAPQDWKLQLPPRGVEIIRYPSGEFEFPAWLAIPRERDPKRKQPAFVYLHGGNAFDQLDFQFCQPALDAGFIVLVPTFRAENGNPGYYEAMLGETDDAAAAVKWLSEQQEVDTERIYVFGHDFGGGIAALLSLREDVPIRHTGSCGGIFHDFSFYAWAVSDTLPFTLSDENERGMRLLIDHLPDMRRPHLAYIGDDDYHKLYLATVTRRLNEIKNEHPEQPTLLSIESLAGDHITSLDESIRRYVEFMKSETATEKIE